MIFVVDLVENIEQHMVAIKRPMEGRMKGDPKKIKYKSKNALVKSGASDAMFAVTLI